MINKTNCKIIAFKFQNNFFSILLRAKNSTFSNLEKYAFMFFVVETDIVISKCVESLPKEFKTRNLIKCIEI